MTTNEQIQKQNEAACASTALHERDPKTGDNVEITSGAMKGQQGEVIMEHRDEKQVYVVFGNLPYGYWFDETEVKKAKASL